MGEGMPTVLNWRGFRFHFYSHEPNEPPHIHAKKDRCAAKFWLSPVALARSQGFTEQEIGVLLRKEREKRSRFLEAWHGYFGSAGG